MHASKQMVERALRCSNIKSNVKQETSQYVGRL
jgi:hypothetical protein